MHVCVLRERGGAQSLSCLAVCICSSLILSSGVRVRKWRPAPAVPETLQWSLCVSIAVPGSPVTLPATVTTEHHDNRPKAQAWTSTRIWVTLGSVIASRTLSLNCDKTLIFLDTKCSKRFSKVPELVLVNSVENMRLLQGYCIILNLDNNSSKSRVREVNIKQANARTPAIPS